MKTCRTCKHFDPDERCFRYPPTYFSYYDPENMFNESDAGYGWARPRVKPDDRACGEHQTKGLKE